MRRRKTHTHTARPTRARDDFRNLLRRPAVQVMLAAAATAQVAATQHAVSGRAQEAPTVALAPVQAVGPGGTDVAQAWRARTMERESDRLASRYRAEGYPVTRELARAIHVAAVEHGIEPDVAFGLVRAESSFKNSSTSPVGAVGLTQLMPRTAAWMQPGVTRSQLRDPETNLRIGFKYLSNLIDKYDGNVDLALVAYNRGPGTVDKALKRGRNPDNGYAAFVRGEKNHGHKLYTR